MMEAYIESTMKKIATPRYEPNVRLISAREDTGLTQAALAEKTGIHKNLICRYEIGRNRPGIKNAEKIAKAFETSISSLFGSHIFVRSGTPLKTIRNDRKDSIYNWRLRKARLEKNFTHREMALSLGVTEQLCAGYEHFRYYPSDELKIKVASLLEQDPDYLFPECFREIASLTRNSLECSIQNYIKRVEKHIDDGKYDNNLPAVEGKLFALESLLGPVPLHEIDPDSLIDRRDGSENRNGFESFEMAELSYVVQKVLSSLSLHKRKILEMRSGLSHFSGSSYTFQDMGDRLSLSRERVRQLLIEACDFVRESSLCDELEAFAYTQS